MSKEKQFEQKMEAARKRNSKFDRIDGNQLHSLPAHNTAHAALSALKASCMTGNEDAFYEGVALIESLIERLRVEYESRN